MKRFCFLIFIAGSTAFAQIEPNHIVKVYAKYASTEFRGSGILFRHGAEAFVLTSDHVTLHEQASVHRAVNEKGEVYTADFAAADYGRGLAILKVTSSFDSSKVVDWKTWQAAKLTIGSPVEMMGFPHQSLSLVRSARGTVANAELPSTLVVQIRNLVLIENGHAEFGMSGGITRTPNGELVGLISHQIYSQIGRIQNDILHIPGSEILTWMGHFFATNGENIELTQSMYQQLYKLPMFSTGNLLLTYHDTGVRRGREVQIVSGSQKLSSLYGGANCPLKPVEDYMSKNDECVLSVTHLKNKISGSVHSVGGLTDFIRLLEDPAFEVQGKVSCMSKERHPSSRH